MVPWKKIDATPLFTAWIATCCDVLQRCAQSDGDYALSYLVQFTNYTNAAADAMNENAGTSDQQSQLMLLGLETQARELQQRMVARVANNGKRP
jgi:SAM-dependent MidA family methyltransferase